MGGWWSWLYGLLYGVGGLTCAGVAMLVAFQEKLVYVPVLPGMKRGYPILPSRLQLRYQDVWLTAKDGVRLHSWYIEAHANNPGVLNDSETLPLPHKQFCGFRVCDYFSGDYYFRSVGALK